MDKEMGRSAELTSEVEQYESDFAEFFIGIISKLHDLKCRQISDDVKSALKDIRGLKSEANKIRNFFFSFKNPPVRCAYMYAYSVLHTVMVHSEFSSLLELNKIFFLPLLSKDTLKICRIGSGAGTEAVAIYRSIADFISKYNIRSNESRLKVCFTVIDKLPYWKTNESAVINAINDESCLFHSKRIVLRSDFMKADILKPFEKSLEEKIEEADIVTIVNVGSFIQEKNSGDCHPELRKMVKNVIGSMNEESSLFMLDNARGYIFYSMRNVLRERRSSYQLRKSDNKKYALHPRTVNKLGGLMIHRKDSEYSSILPDREGKVSSCLWIKNVTRVSENTEDSM